MNGPIANQQEADDIRALIAEAEAEYPDPEDRPETVDSLIAASKSKLASWDERQKEQSA